MDHAVVAGLRIAFAQFAHGLRHRLVECEAKADVLQDDGEENGGIGTAASGLHDARIDRECTVRNDVAALVVRNVAIVDEAQAVRIEGLLVLKNQRQVGAGQAQVPQAAARRSVGELVENRIMTGGDGVFVDRGAGFRSRRTAVATVWRFVWHGDQRGAPAVVVDLAQISEIAHVLHAEHAIEVGVAACRRESK